MLESIFLGTEYIRPDYFPIPSVIKVNKPLALAGTGPTALVQNHHAGQPSPQWFTHQQGPQYPHPGAAGTPHHQTPPAQLHPFIMQPAVHHPPMGPRLCPRAAQLGMK